MPDRWLDPGQGGVAERGTPLGAFLEGPAEPGVVLADLPIPLLDGSERLDHGLGHPPLQLAVWLAGKFLLDLLPAELPDGTVDLEQVGDAWTRGHSDSRLGVGLGSAELPADGIARADAHDRV